VISLGDHNTCSSKVTLFLTFQIARQVAPINTVNFYQNQDRNYETKLWLAKKKSARS
jgi:hypothetical protein